MKTSHAGREPLLGKYLRRVALGCVFAFAFGVVASGVHAGIPKNVVPEIEGKPGRNGLIVYVQKNRNSAGSYYQGSSGIYSYNPRTRKHSRLVRSEHASHPRFTASGNRVIYVDEVRREARLYSMKPDGSDRREIASDVSDGYPYPAIIPGNRIWFLNTAHEAITINLDGSGLHNQGEAKGQITLGSSTANGAKLIYQPEEGRSNGDIHVYDRSTGKRTRLKGTAWATEPRISPDGHWLTFVSSDFNNLWIMRTNGTKMKRVVYVTGTLGLGEPMFAPDGYRMLAKTYSGGIASYLTHFSLKNLGRNGPFFNVRREGSVYLSDADWQSR